MDEITKNLKKSWNRLSAHFIDYIKAYVATLVIFIGLGLISAGIAISFFAIAKTINTILLYVLVAPLIFAIFAGFVYASAWTGLVTIDSIIGKIGTPIKERFKNIRPHVAGFVVFNILLGLFMIGITPFGILSIGTIFIFWVVVSSFTAFIYLEHKVKGLSPLWISKQMISKQFWKLVIYFVLIYGVVFVIDAVLLKTDHVITRITSWIMNFIATPLFIAVKYELYKQSDYPKKIAVPKNWILLSKVGFVIIAIVLVAVISQMGRLGSIDMNTINKVLIDFYFKNIP